MHLISILLFALSANIDNFTVGISYGIRRIRIEILSNLLIAVVTGAGTFLSMSIGLAACKFMAPSVSNIIGSAILILIGLWVIKDFFLKKDKSDKHMNKGPKREFFFNQLLVKPEKADFDNSGRIDAKESLVLALALSINNFGLGLGASITGLNIYITSAGTFLFSIISVILGYKLGNSGISKFLGKYAALVSGIVIILLGLYEMLV